MALTIQRYWRQGDRFSLLLISLVTTLLLVPAVHSPLLQRILGAACFTLVFATGALANRHRPRIFKTAIALAVTAIVMAWTRLAVDTATLHAVRLALEIVFFAFIAVVILVAVINDRLATLQAILGAICAYLLLGLAWAHGYLLLEQFEPDSFRYTVRQFELSMIAGNPSTALSQMVYYSFVTMTTLGYGDIVPVSPLAQTVTWMQAVMGQLFLVVTIARLVSELPRISRGD